MQKLAGIISLCFLQVCFLAVAVIPRTEFECLQYSDHLTDKTMYRLNKRGNWMNLTCRPGTKWNRDKCYCAIDKSQEEAQNPQHDHCKSFFQPVAGKRSQYKQLNTTNSKWETKDCRDFDDKLFWDQTVCMCVQLAKAENKINVDPDSTGCDTMFDSCFDENTFKNAKHYITRKDEQKVRIVDEVDAFNGKAVFINQDPLSVPSFKENELGMSFQIYVRFKLEETERKELTDTYQVIFSNKCDNHSATISCSYKPSSYSYRILLQNDTQLTPVIQECSYEAGDRFTSWKSIYILYEDGEITMAVNGKPCLHFEFTGYPKFKCDLAIGGNPSTNENGTSDESIMLGYVDVMSVDRNCRSPIH